MKRVVVFIGDISTFNILSLIHFIEVFSMLQSAISVPLFMKGLICLVEVHNNTYTIHQNNN